jgi:hypothetical protein
MGILRTNTISGLGTDGPVFNGVTKFDTQGYFVPPSGTTDQRSAGITTAQGTIRFNTDSQKLEFYAQDQWWEMVTDTPNLGVSSNTDAGARGVFSGGNVPTLVNTIDYINIHSTGNATDFGDLTASRDFPSSCSSSIRGLFVTGRTITNTIDYVTISSTGDAQDFGDSSQARTFSAACSSPTRGISAGGATPTYQNTIDYVTISSTGNAQDFGDLSFVKGFISSCSSPTRGVFGGGITTVPTTTYLNLIEFVTISTLGNTFNFGDLSFTRSGGASCSSSTRAVFGGGYSPGGTSNVIDYITFSTLGSAQNFGDLITARGYLSSCSSSTRGLFGGGTIGSLTNVNVIEYVTITSAGDSVDFGDLTVSRHGLSACSNAHGGL